MTDVDLAIEKLKELGYPDLATAVLDLLNRWLNTSAPWEEY